jgi:hypothetical protein
MEIRHPKFSSYLLPMNLSNVLTYLPAGGRVLQNGCGATMTPARNRPLIIIPLFRTKILYNFDMSIKSPESLRSVLMSLSPFHRTHIIPLSPHSSLSGSCLFFGLPVGFRIQNLNCFVKNQPCKMFGRSLAKRLTGRVFGVCDLRSIYTYQADGCFCAIRNYPDGISIDDASDLVLTGE